MPALIFCGPSVSAGEILEDIPDAQLRGPAAVGDVYRAMRDAPAAIGIIDGVFDQQLAVRHKEILWALAHGVRIYGAASMGALRAAELAAFGMTGVGQIYQWYASGELEDDDEVTVVHEGAERGYRMHSDAMVNIRATLSAAVDRGVLTQHGAAALITRLKGEHYTERRYELVARVGAEVLPDAELAPTLRWLRDRSNRIDQKRLDARALAARMRQDRDLLAQPCFEFEYTEAWHALRCSLDAELDETR